MASVLTNVTHGSHTIEPDDPARQLIYEIGQQLDRQIYPRVYDGGLVVPSETPVAFQLVGMEIDHAEQRPQGSAARPRQGTTRREGPTDRSWSADPATPLVSASPGQAHDQELSRLCSAYPSSRVWTQPDGLWLLVRSSVVAGLDREAVFVIAVPREANAHVQAWGFWDHGCLAFAQWIGPRHTNFPYGSICAFEPTDGTWRNGESLLQLVDIYTLWAARQLHLEYFKRWPGSQVARWRYERQLETQPDELCSCGSLDRTYAQCCQQEDLRRASVAEALRFLRETCGGTRQPPLEVINFLRTQVSPPEITAYV